MDKVSVDYRILQIALEELQAAADYVEAERPGFGLRLLEEYEDIVEFLLRHPSAGTPVDLIGPYEFRRFQMRRFRHSVFTAQSGNIVTVLAVSHHKRAPAYWIRRLVEV